MRVTLKLQRVGMTMEEATLNSWHVQPGDQFEKGDVLYEIETEKVVEEITAPGAGTLIEALVDEDDVIEVGDAICVIEVADDTELPDDAEES